MLGSRTMMAAASVVGVMVAGAAPAATLVDFGDPWAQIGTVKAAMDEAFGAGAWRHDSTPADAGFLANETFVYVEGGDHFTDETAAFLGRHAGEILDWIKAGGRMFINAATTRDDTLTFAGLSISNPHSKCDSGCVASDPSHPIFDDIEAASFDAGSFSHGTVTGGTSIIEDGKGNSLLAELTYGSGRVLMGTMTTTNWHRFDEAQELRANVLAYGAGDVAPPAPVPLPATALLLAGGLGSLAALRRRATKA